MSRVILAGANLELAHRLRAAMIREEQVSVTDCLTLATMPAGARHVAVSMARGITSTKEHPRHCFADSVPVDELRNRVDWQLNRFKNVIGAASEYSRLKILWTWWEISRDWVSRLVDNRTISAFVHVRGSSNSTEYVDPDQLLLLSVRTVRVPFVRTQLAIRPVKYGLTKSGDKAYQYGYFDKPTILEVQGSRSTSCTLPVVRGNDVSDKLGQDAFQLCMQLFTTADTAQLRTPEVAVHIPIDSYRPEMDAAKEISDYVDTQFESWCQAGRPSTWADMPQITAFAPISDGVTLSKTVDKTMWNRVCREALIQIMPTDNHGMLLVNPVHLPEQLRASLNRFKLDASSIGLNNPQVVESLEGSVGEWVYDLNWPQ